MLNKLRSIPNHKVLALCHLDHEGWDLVAKDDTNTLCLSDRDELHVSCKLLVNLLRSWARFWRG